VKGVAVCAALATALATTPAHAWLFVEHTEIGRMAFEEGDAQVPRLTEAQRSALDRAWQRLRAGGTLGSVVYLAKGVAEKESPVDYPPSPFDDTFSSEIDVPMLAALAGDHSCNADDLAATARSSWVQPLIKLFGGNYQKIRKTRLDSAARVSIWHFSNLKAQEIDDEYLSRASHNAAHFVLARMAPLGAPDTLRDYVSRASGAGAAMNAVGLYVTYHARALAAAHGDAGDPLVLEAMALHFLEDGFASGHVVGSPKDGTSASRSGTHDYYCTNGLSTVTWSGARTYSAFGDAHLQPTDRLLASEAVRASLAQLADALDGGVVPRGCGQSVVVDACIGAALPGVLEDCVAVMEPILELLPAAPLAYTPQPLFRNEVGAFVRFALNADGGLGWTSAASPPSPGPVETVPTWGLAGGVGVGFSVDGVTTTSSDATGFIQVGISAASGQRTQFCVVCSTSQEPVETRLGLDFRMRLPFWAIPGDFLIVGPAAGLGSKWAYNRVVQTAEGGLYGRWERVFTLENGTAFQVVAGREVEVSVYSLSRLLTSEAEGLIPSWSLTTPLVDFLAVRRFSDTTSSHLKLSLSYRHEHSSAATGEFAVLSLSSDSHLYFSGF
jgi:hypothetical protein